MRAHRTQTAVASPFFSRAYGGYTDAQEVYYRNAIGSMRGKAVLDPMAGQAYAISRLAHEGAKVYVGDLNPAMALLAGLRSPEVIGAAAKLCDAAKSILAKVSRRKRPPANDYCDTWLTPTILADLEEYASLIGLGLFANPYAPDGRYWDLPTETRFLTGIVLLAAREICCFRLSDNITWPKPGGLVRETRIGPAVNRAIIAWESYANAVQGTIRNRGSLYARRLNAATEDFPRKRVDAVVTSPPYANRMDYTRLWAPESEVLAAMCQTSTAMIRREQIGTIVLRNRIETKAEFKSLPTPVRRALEEIKSDPAAYSGNYYFPFFSMYATSLALTLRRMSQRVKTGGRVIIFVRDTVRKDVLFPTGTLVSKVLQQDCGFRCINQTRRIIKQHVGLLRKASANGVYGLAQQEWWLTFEKE